MANKILRRKLNIEPQEAFWGRISSSCFTRDTRLAIVLSVFLRITSGFWLFPWYKSSNFSKSHSWIWWCHTNLIYIWLYILYRKELINKCFGKIKLMNYACQIIISDQMQNWLGLGLLCLTPLSTIFQLYCSSQFYWWRKPEHICYLILRFWTFY
jgi:hypothetical protein